MLMALPLLLILATIIPRAETFAPLPLKTGLLPFQSSSSSSSSQHQHQHQHQHQPLLLSSSLEMSATTGTGNSDAETTTTGNVDVDVDVVVVDRSTLTLLEHVNLNVPSHEHILPFYFGLLGCGMDPRKAANLAPDAAKKTLWANCGASQFHLPYGVTAQRIPGHVGLRFRDLQGLEGRLEAFKAHYASAERGKDPGTGRDYIRITDHYGNVFVCRAREMSEDGSSSSTTSSNAQQPFIRPEETEKWGEVATTYGRLETECRGIDYVEFSCPMGMASKIALFYESVLDATTTVVDTGTNGSSIAIIAVGNVDEQGRTDQSILFRETTEPIAEYDGHHIALYVGETAADFEQAFKNANLANIVWCNPRFQDQADTLDEARKEQQFRFKNIVDMETGETIMELEHELRSIQHPSWPGKSDE